MGLLDQLFCDKLFIKVTLGIQIIKKFISEDVFEYNFNHSHLLICIFKQFGCPKWFWQKFCQKKTVNQNHSYLKYALRWCIASSAANISLFQAIFKHFCEYSKKTLLFLFNWRKFLCSVLDGLSFNLYVGFFTQNASEILIFDFQGWSHKLLSTLFYASFHLVLFFSMTHFAKLSIPCSLIRLG